MLTFNIATSAKDIEKAIGETIARHCYNSVYNPLIKLKRQVYNFIESSIEDSPEADDLINGFLRVEFGLESPVQSVKSIINAIIQVADIHVDPFRYTGKVEMAGGIYIGFLRTDLREVLSLGEPLVEFTSEGKHADRVPWLEWLLLGGTGPLLEGFILSYSPVHTQYSRTGGGALMFPSASGTYSLTSGFVPPSFSGVSGDNWLTRAFSKIKDYLDPLVEAEFKRAFA